VALAAGAGTRLRPITVTTPKPLCPVGGRPLLDWSLDALATVTRSVAVNAHHGLDQIQEHLSLRPRVHLSIETSQPLGTAGAIGQLRPWLDGRAVLVVNADTWHRADLAAFVAGWDGARVRILSSGPMPFGARSGIVASILPWSVASQLEATPSGLWECVWRNHLEADRLDVVSEAGPVVDCGTPVDYLAANMMTSGGRSVVADGAVVRGSVERCVVWSGARVEAHERLVDAIRTDRITVLVR